MPPPIAVCLGASPEAVRLAPAIHALHGRGVPTVLVTAGGTNRALDDTLATFDLTPEIDLRPALAPSGDAIDAIGGALAFVRPSAVLVQAHTATATAAAPAAFSRGIAIAQVEAGAGTADADEGLLAHLATWQFARDAAARDRLLAGGVDARAIEITGGTVGEAARWVAERGGLLRTRRAAGPRRVLVALGAGSADGVLGRVLARLAERADVEIAIAAARSPVLRGALAAHDNVTLLEAPRFGRFVAALAASHLLLTDAPAAADAATALGVRTVTLGDPARAYEDAERALDDNGLHRRLVPVATGEESAAARIATRLAAAQVGAIAADVHSATLAA